EVSWLSLITARLEAIVRSDRNVHLFFVVPIHVTEPHVVGAVRVGVEPFVHRCHCLTGSVSHGDELSRTGLSEDWQGRDYSEDSGESKRLGHHKSAFSEKWLGDYRADLACLERQLLDLVIARRLRAAR